MTLVSTEKIIVNLVPITDPGAGPDGWLLVSPARRLQVYLDHALFQGFADFMIGVAYRSVPMVRNARTVTSQLLPDNSSAWVQWDDVYSDGSQLTVRWTLTVQRVKLTLVLHNARKGSYGLLLTIGNLYGFGTMVPVTIQGTIVSFKATDGTPILFDWSDVFNYQQSGVTGLQGTAAANPANFTVTLLVLITFNALGYVSIDPFVDGAGGTAATDPEQLRWNGKRLFGTGSDKFNKIWIVQGHATGNCQFVYSNNGGSSFTAVDLGASFAVAGGPTAVAYDKTNDKFILGWAKAGDTKVQFAQGTITRDLSNSITGVTMGSVLQITDNPSSMTGVDVLRDIDGWFLSNGECGFVWGRNNPLGAMAKNNQTRFCRVVFGSPPTYKSLNATASTVDNVGSNDTGGDDRSFVNIVQDPYDNTLFAGWCHRVPGQTNDTVVYKYSSGSLGGSWAAETTLYSAGAFDFDADGMDHRIFLMATGTLTPQMLVYLYASKVPATTKCKVYGRLNGGSITQLDGDQDDGQGGGIAHPHGSVCKGTVNSVRIRTRASPSYGISLHQWNGAAWGNQEDMESPSSNNNLGSTFPKANVESNLVEVVYGNQKPSPSFVWEIRYTSLDITPVSGPPLQFSVRVIGF